MPLFRRREPLHVRLAREGGLDELRPVDTRPGWGEVGIHGVARPREWDAVATARADLDADEASFVVLADGTPVSPDGSDVATLAAAVALEPPFRAEAVRRPDGTWAVGARRIRVARLAVRGDLAVLTVGPDGRELLVDGERASLPLRELEPFLGGRDGVVEARRLQGDLFEVRVHAL